MYIKKMTASTPNSVRASRIEICSVTCGSHTCAQRVNNNMLRMTRSRGQRHTPAVSAPLPPPSVQHAGPQAPRGAPRRKLELHGCAKFLRTLSTRVGSASGGSRRGPSSTAATTDDWNVAAPRPRTPFLRASPDSSPLATSSPSRALLRGASSADPRLFLSDTTRRGASSSSLAAGAASSPPPNARIALFRRSPASTRMLPLCARECE